MTKKREPAPSAAERSKVNLLRYFLDHSGATCRGAAESLGMSFPNVCRLVLSQFKPAGLVISRDSKQTGQRGPHSQVFTLKPGLGATIGIDLEATRIRCLVMDFSNNVTDVLRSTVSASAGPDEVVSAVAELSGQAVRQAHGRGLRPWAVGLALPGPVLDVGRARIRTELQFGDALIEFVPAVSERAGIPAFSAPNTHCFAAAHGRLGTDHWPVELVILNRYGIGAAVSWKGKIFTGSSQVAGEIGRLWCGAVSPARRYHELCTGASLLRLDRQHGRRRSLGELIQSPMDPVVQDWLVEAIPAFADAICTTTVAYNPDRVLIDGVFNSLPSEIRTRVTARVIDELAPTGFRIPVLEFFEGDDLMGARGAAYLARDQVADEAIGQALEPMAS